MSLSRGLVLAIERPSRLPSLIFSSAEANRMYCVDVVEIVNLENSLKSQAAVRGVLRHRTPRPSTFL
jgi:hypothetical protein